MSLFDNVPENQIFEERDVLKGKGSPIEKPVGQISLRSSLSSIVRLLNNRRSPPSLFISGPLGSGKTYITDYCLEKQPEQSNDQSDYFTVWLKKTNGSNRYEVLLRFGIELEKRLPKSDRVPKITRGYSESKTRELIRNRLQALSSPVVIIFDEFDISEGVQALLTDFLVQYKQESKNTTAVGLIFISYENQYRTLANCFSESGPIHIELDRYSREELNEILSRRADIAFKPSCASQRVIEKCAKISHERNMSPREAQELLKFVGDSASRTGESTLSEDHIREAVSRMEE